MGRWKLIGHCWMCGKFRILWFLSPVDPPFYGDKPARHCRRCERWLQHGD